MACVAAELVPEKQVRSPDMTFTLTSCETNRDGSNHPPSRGAAEADWWRVTLFGSRHRGPVSALAVWNELLGSALIATVTYSPEFSVCFFSSPRSWEMFISFRACFCVCYRGFRREPRGRCDSRECWSINQNTGKTSTSSSVLGVVYSSFPCPVLSY